MEKYIIKQKIGVGSFGEVYLVESEEDDEKLAMKKMKEHFGSQQEVRNLVEVKILAKLKHPNIIQLKDVIYDKQSQEGRLFFQYCQSDICKKFCYSKSNRSTELQIKKHIFQIASALAFAHQKNYIHRDLKPQNILVQQNQFEGKVVDVAKLCDFGISKSADELPLTDYVGTRWYRAPQLLIKMKNYSKKVDVFSLGCIMAEFYNMEILFNGKNSLEQLVMIMKKLGTPSKQTWPEFSNWCKLKGITYGKYQKSEDPIIFRAKPDSLAEDLVQKMLVMNPKLRISSEEVLKHPYFDEIREQMLTRQYAVRPIKQSKSQQTYQHETEKQSKSESDVKTYSKNVENAQLQTDHSTHKRQDDKTESKLSKVEVSQSNQSKQTEITEIQQSKEEIKQTPPTIVKSPQKKVKTKSPIFYCPYGSNVNGREKKFDYYQTYVLNRKNHNKTKSTWQEKSQNNQSHDSKNYLSTNKFENEKEQKKV